jgi:hypothetical protein
MHNCSKVNHSVENDRIAACLLFLKAAVAFPILGADFLHQFDLILRVRKQLLYSAGGWSVNLTPYVPATTSFSVVIPVGLFSQESAADTVPPAASLCAGLTVDKLAKEFPSVFSSTTVLPEARHGIEHQIITTGRPVTARYRRLDAAKYKAACDEFLQVLCGGPQAAGLPPYIWLRSRTARGARAATIAV